VLGAMLYSAKPKNPVRKFMCFVGLHVSYTSTCSVANSSFIHHLYCYSRQNATVYGTA